MSKRKAIFACLILICLLVMGSSMCAMAGMDYSYVNPYTGYSACLEDGARLLDGDSAAMEPIEVLMQSITAYGDIAVITIGSNDASARSYAKERRSQLFGDDSSSVFLIDEDNREIYIYSYGTMYKYITTAKANIITDNTYQYATDGYYNECVLQTLDQMNTVLEGGKINQSMKYISNALLAVLFALMIVFLWAKENSISKVVEVDELLEFTAFSTILSRSSANRIRQTRSRHSSDDSGSGGSSGGGGHSGGGGGHGF